MKLIKSVAFLFCLPLIIVYSWVVWPVKKIKNSKSSRSHLQKEIQALKQQLADLETAKTSMQNTLVTCAYIAKELDAAVITLQQLTAPFTEP